MSLRIAMAGPAYDARDARVRRVEEIVQRVETLPGVEAAFASNLVPISGGGGGGDVEIDGRAGEPGRPIGIGFIGVTPGFFRTLGVTMRAGRDFTAADGRGRTAVAVINETMARRYWDGRDPIGGRFRMIGDTSADWFTVVGVSPDMRVYPMSPDDLSPEPQAFVPYVYQQTVSTGLSVRVAGGDPAAITPALGAAIRAVDPNLPITQVRTLDEVRRLSYWEFGLYGWIFGTTGVVGLLLAAVGVYGVLSYSVEQRTREIGVRVALGAERPVILWLIVRHGLALVGIGIVIGLAMSLMATPWARSFLFQVSPFDPLSFACVSLLLLVVAALASYVPALRATRVDPIIVLKSE
jgi:predicted permease